MFKPSPLVSPNGFKLQPVIVFDQPKFEQPSQFDTYESKYGHYANDFIKLEQERSNDRISIAMRENLLRL